MILTQSRHHHIMVAGASVVYTRRQAIETKNQVRTKTVADIEQARRTDELTDRKGREHQELGADVRMSIDVSRGRPPSATSVQPWRPGCP